LEGYALIVGKGGERLRPSPSDPTRPKGNASFTSGDRNAGEGHARSEDTSEPDRSGTVDKERTGTQTLKFDRETWTQHWELSKMTMHDLAERLGVCVDSSYHKVVDETGLQGFYQVAYDCPMARPPLRAGSSDAGALPPDPQGSYSLTRSLDALGLKLEKRKVLQDVYVIDHIERPSEN
jgi:uncharacterized protein (TIGR03435 family)